MDTIELLQQKDEQIEALSIELERFRTNIEEARHAALPPPPSSVPIQSSVNETLRQALDSQIVSNKQLSTHNKTLQRRLIKLEQDVKNQHQVAETEQKINKDLNDVVQRAGSTMLLRDHEVRGLQQAIRAREDEIRTLRNERVDAQRALLDERTASREVETDMNRLRYDNGRLKEMVKDLQEKARAYQSVTGTILDVPEIVVPPESLGGPRPSYAPALLTLRKQNQQLQEQYQSSLLLLQRQVHADTLNVVAAAARPKGRVS